MLDGNFLPDKPVEWRGSGGREPGIFDRYMADGARVAAEFSDIDSADAGWISVDGDI